MVAEVTREEFEARMSVLEREVEGEKLVTRHILEQTRRNGDDLAAIKGRLAGIEKTLGGVDLRSLANKVDGLDRKVEGLDRKINDLTKNLPGIISEAMREAIRERDGKR